MIPNFMARRHHDRDQSGAGTARRALRRRRATPRAKGPAQSCCLSGRQRTLSSPRMASRHLWPHWGSNSPPTDRSWCSNTIRNHYTRRMPVKASRSLIESNRIANFTLRGIVVTLKLYWGKGDFVADGFHLC